MTLTRFDGSRIRLGIAASLAAGLSALGACRPPDAGDASAGPPFTLGDSAGVEIVVNHRPSWADGRAWRIDPEPVLRIGSQQGGTAHEFAGVVGAVPLPGGGVAVADEGSGQVRFFDAAGAIEGTIGGRGRGPGEFTTLAELGRGPSGRLWAYDFALRRVSWIRPADETITSTTLGPEPPVLAAAGPLPGGSFALRQLWGAAGVARADRAGVRRDSALVVVFDSAGALIDTVGSFPGRELVIRIEDGRGVMTTRPFGADLAVVTRDTAIVVGTQHEPVLEEYAAYGQLRRRIVLPDRDERSIGESDVEAYLERRLADVPEEDRADVRSDLRTLPFPERKPAYGGLVVDAAHRLWIGEWAPEGRTARRWSVVDAGGVLLGDVALPVGFRLLSVGADRVVGVERDELDTEYVVVYRLLK